MCRFQVVCVRIRLSEGIASHGFHVLNLNVLFRLTAFMRDEQGGRMKLVTVAYLMLFFAITAYGAVINVPGDQPNIQAGVNDASDGDTVLVADGTYSGAGYN